ncbi:hypothetical protein ACFPRL_03010 [Pseudoclavibacter helvolus]
MASATAGRDDPRSESVARSTGSAVAKLNLSPGTRATDGADEERWAPVSPGSPECGHRNLESPQEQLITKTRPSQRPGPH